MYNYIYILIWNILILVGWMLDLLNYVNIPHGLCYISVAVSLHLGACVSPICVKMIRPLFLKHLVLFEVLTDDSRFTFLQMIMYLRIVFMFLEQQLRTFSIFDRLNIAFSTLDHLAHLLYSAVKHPSLQYLPSKC